MDIKQFAFKVNSMRKAQNDYFTKIKTAKKTKLAADFAAASTALKDSKRIETEVDAAIIEIISKPCDGNCGMNYCDENGCVERKRELVPITEKPC